MIKQINLEKKSFFVDTSHVQVSNSFSEIQPFNFNLPPPPSIMERQYTCYGNFEIKDNEERYGSNNIPTIFTELLEIYIDPLIGDAQSMLPDDHNSETWDMENLLLGSLKELPTP